MKPIPAKKLILLAVLMLISSPIFSQNLIGNRLFGEETADGFGQSISMPDAKNIGIASPYYRKFVTNGGQVKVYTWKDTAWILKGAPINGKAQNDAAYSVSMPHANFIAVGSPLASNSAGNVKIYQFKDSVWVQKGKTLIGEANYDQFGSIVSMPDSNTVAVGAPFNSGFKLTAGHTRVFRWNGMDWVQKGADIDGEAAGDHSGKCVNMPDSNTIAIGAPDNSGNGNRAGNTRIFTWNGSNWIQKGSDIDGEAANDFSGYKVSMPNPNTIAISAYGNDGVGKDAGHVRVYSWTGSDWVQKGSDINGNDSFDWFGLALSMPNANTVAIGAFQTNVHYVKVFNWNGSNWVLKCPQINGDSESDFIGRSLHMPDANSLAISGDGYDGTVYSLSYVKILSLCKTTLDTISKSACNKFVSPSGRYTWLKSGIYTDTIKRLQACDSVITVNLTVNLVDVTVNITSPILTANATGVGYEWLDCDNQFTRIPGANNRNFTAPYNGNFAVKITQNGCSDTSTCISVNNAGTMENNRNTIISLFPNPTKGELMINLGSAEKNGSVIVRNILGNTIAEQSFSNSQNIPIHIHGDAGIYFIEIRTKSSKSVIKVVKL